ALRATPLRPRRQEGLTFSTWTSSIEKGDHAVRDVNLCEWNEMLRCRDEGAKDCVRRHTGVTGQAQRSFWTARSSPFRESRSRPWMFERHVVLSHRCIRWNPIARYAAT